MTSHFSASVCERYRDYLRLLARWQMVPLLQGKMDASDLVQETLLRACSAWPTFQYRSDADLMVWLRSILVNCFRDALRRYQAVSRNARLEIDLAQSIDETSRRLEEWVIAEYESPHSALGRHEELLRLSGALLSLPEDQRRVVELKYLQGLRLGEIADTLGRSRASVAGLLRRGMEHLRELMQ
jgi:RNA polymerase sigma-70 factor (ECF subfamily)